MGSEQGGGSGSGGEGRAAPGPLSAERADRLSRRVALLVGVVPLPRMTQAEVDWVFRQCVRLAE